jgi:hypothetical protein
VRQTSTGYGLPLVGSDCFVYVTEESYTHPDVSTFNTVSYALLRVNPQTGQRTRVIDLDQAGNFYLVGQDPVTREIYLADTITSNQSVLYSLGSGATALTNQGVFPGIHLVGTQDMQHTYYAPFDGTHSTRQLPCNEVGGPENRFAKSGRASAERAPDCSAHLGQWHLRHQHRPVTGLAGRPPRPRLSRGRSERARAALAGYEFGCVEVL